MHLPLSVQHEPRLALDLVADMRAAEMQELAYWETKYRN